MIITDPKTNQSINFVLPNTKKLGINCSGGADSSILLLLIFNYIIENNLDMKLTIITSVNDFRKRLNAIHVTQVINYIIEKTKKNFINEHILFYRDMQKNSYFHDIEFFLLKNEKVDFFCNALTCNPKANTFVENINGEIVDLIPTARRDRDGSNHLVYAGNKEFGSVWYRPFVNVDKRFIKFLYEYFNAEDLFELTRSCEPEMAKDNNLLQKDLLNPCGKCWWCLERKWAFGKF